MRSFLLILTAVVFPAFAQNDLPAEAWLQKMSQALQETQYRASMVQVQADHIRPLVYLHGTVDAREIAFLEYLNGPPQKAVRVGETVTFLEHDQPAYSVKANRIQGTWPQSFSGNIESLAKGYQFVLGGRSRIAGRPGQLIRFIPNDQHRFGYQIWLDMESYLPLRFDTLSRDKTLLEQLMVVEMAVLDVTPVVLTEAAKHNWPEASEVSQRSGGQNWSFSWLPDGFKIVVRDLHQLYGSGQPVEYISLSDGLVNLSVYVSPSGKAPLPEELTTTNGLSIVTEKSGEFEVVVVGQAPSETLITIAKSLTLEK
ncbi:MAG: MucB/RseB [Shewanella sp.]|nr:MucB/RseB [Shewanella sp.]